MSAEKPLFSGYTVLRKVREVEEVVADIHLPNFRLRVHEDLLRDRVGVVIKWDVPNQFDRDERRRARVLASLLIIQLPMTVAELLQKVHYRCVETMIYETAENFLFRGQKIYDPDCTTDRPYGPPAIAALTEDPLLLEVGGAL